MTGEEKIWLSKVKLDKARWMLSEALNAYNAGVYTASTHSSCYVVLHCIRAVLCLDGFDSKTHKQLTGQFNRNYVKTGIFPRDTYKLINRVYTLRERGDYDEEFRPTVADAAQQYQDAEWFFSQVSQHLCTRYGTG
jgi:uncharacterized protein (UPF0332 family)